MKKLTKYLLAGLTGLAGLAVQAPAVQAQAKVTLTYSDTVPANDIRSQILRKAFGQCLGSGFDFKPYFGATLFKQGTELTAMERGNLDMASLAIYDLYDQVPQTSILGTAYLFKNYAHMRKVYDSGILDPLWKLVDQKTHVHFLAAIYIGTRELNLRGHKKIMTPADLKGVKLRMPGGEGWQFVGKALGANPTPLPFTEVYTALQTGAIDGQDNPLPTDKDMKFYEVTNQIVLTGHLIAANIFSIRDAKWNSMTPAQQAKVQGCANNFQKTLDAEVLGREKTMQTWLKAHGMTIYTPDKKAFRDHVLQMYMDSKYSKDWPKGLLAEINKL